MRRFHPLVFVDDLEGLEVSRELGHHLVDVRRFRVGTTLFAGDGHGQVRSVSIAKVRPRVQLRPLSAIEFIERSSPPVGIAMFVPSNERLAWAVQKLTEVGTDEIQFLVGPRDRRGGASISAAGLDRLTRIAREAAQQAERLWLPRIESPQPTDAYFASATPGIAILDPEGGTLSSKVTTLVVGPESGAISAPDSIPRVSLGLPILRIETAAVAGAVVLAAIRASLVSICDNSC